jgi:two-component system, chemotaxis family, protein-glutamate methylesterase/glutaminase
MKVGRLRALVVEDSLTVRRRLCDVLTSSNEIEIAGEAEDGKQAIELCQKLRPDVMTLDMHLPVMSGLTATEYIMAHCPTPILIVSSSTNRGDLFKTYDALAAGAVDVLEKPLGDELDDAWERKLIYAVKLVARIKVITHPRARLASARGAPSPAVFERRPELPQDGFRGVALGASTGGPAALVDVLRAIPRRLPVPILVVLHIGELFGAAFAEWLGEQTMHSVANVRDGEPVASAGGRVLLAPPGRHLVVRNGAFHLTLDPERHSCRPSIDVLFESVAREFGRNVLACLLTGMGRDGATGLLEIRRAGGLTIAQDEATSVVYGMPREAVQLGAAERVLPLGEIGPAIAKQFGAVVKVQR